MKRRLVRYVILGVVLVILGFWIIAYCVFNTARAADRPCRPAVGDARCVSVGGFDLYYRAIGTGSDRIPVVLLHGGPGMSGRSFNDSFHFLAADRPVIYYDQRGSGFSQIKPDPSHYTVEGLVEELEALRRDVMGARQIIVIGHSAGGALAQRYALAYADHVAGLVLVSSIPINNNSTLSGFVPEFFFSGLFVLQAGFPPADPAAADDWFTEQVVQDQLATLHVGTDPAVLDHLGEISFVTWREVSFSLWGDAYEDDLRQLAVPTLIIYGAAEEGFTGEKVARSLHLLLPDSTLVRMENSGHWSFLEEPERFRQVLTGFLSEVDPGGVIE